jgi:hypothetical protein
MGISYVDAFSAVLMAGLVTGSASIEVSLADGAAADFPLAGEMETFTGGFFSLLLSHFLVSSE